MAVDDVSIVGIGGLIIGLLALGLNIAHSIPLVRHWPSGRIHLVDLIARAAVPVGIASSVSGILILSIVLLSGVVDEMATTAAVRDPIVVITSPRDRSSVPLEVSVEGESRGVAQSAVAPRSIYVVVRPIPSDPNQSWWVQPYAAVAPDGRWSGTAYAGIESDVPGTPFDICAIVSEEQLEPGRYGGLPPPALS